MSTWPATLPDPLVDGHSEPFADVRVVSEMEEGPAKVRAWGTNNAYVLPLVYLMTSTQLSTLRTFYETTTSHGTTTFDFTHPRTSATVTARFAPKAPPPAAVPHGPSRWRVSLSLEVIPS